MTTKPSIFSRLLCFFGIHGPNVLGHEPQPRSCREGPFIRKCWHCGAVWHGREVTRNNVRTLGDWRKVK